MQFEYQIKIVKTHFRFPEARFHFYIVCLLPLSENVFSYYKDDKKLSKIKLQCITMFSYFKILDAI